MLSCKWAEGPSQKPLRTGRWSLAFPKEGKEKIKNEKREKEKKKKKIGGEAAQVGRIPALKTSISLGIDSVQFVNLFFNKNN